MMTLRTQLAQLKEIFLDLLFPPRCVGCGSDQSFLCDSCRQSLPRVVPPFCERCGLPLAEGTLCPACWRSPLAIDGIRSLFLFEGAAREAIHQLKYQNLKAIAEPLGELLWEYLKANPIPAQVLVPVPLHRKRVRQRGYNQSLLLARELGRRAGLRLAEGSLLRLRNTMAQARTSSAEERQRNVQGAFGCGDQQLSGKAILLVDDVCTTGNTLDACASVLKECGAASVWGLTLAREI